MIEDKDKFLEFAESLKLVRRYRIEDSIKDKNIDDIYTDLLPNNGIISKMNLPRTTLLVGRKGTGKSTIFQKSQKDLISNKKCISIYIDVKSLYENSTPHLPDEIDNKEEIHKLLIFTNLIKDIILETKNKLSEFVHQSILKKVLGFDLHQIELITEELNSIESSILDVVKTIDVSFVKSLKKHKEIKSNAKSDDKLVLSKNPSISFQNNHSSLNSESFEFEQKLITYLDIKGNLIDKLKSIRKILGVNHLYIFLDDFSEIEEDAQKIFIDHFVAPLNNNSEDFVKFKIAVYPNRFYYGKLDNSKLDEISLDFYDAFYSYEKITNISKMEALALDYTKRLIKKRLELFFPNNNWERFFDIKEDELFDTLFSASFNNPRKIGYLLSFCYESCLIHDIKITQEAIENASKRFFKDVILNYFLANHFVTKSFNDNISIEHQYQLLLKIIERQKLNSSSSNKSRLKGKPANHFIVKDDMSGLIDSLELNGFITTYNSTTDSNGNPSFIYSLDLGLCKMYDINFMRAKEKKVLTYFQNPRFNMNIVISEYFNKTQILRCSNGHEFPYEMLETLRNFKMRCPNCLDQGNLNSFCQVTLSSDEIREKLKEINSKKINKVDIIEIFILDYLIKVSNAVSLTKISETIDKNISSVKIGIHKLIEKQFVEQDLAASKAVNKEVFKITRKGTELINKLFEAIKNLSRKTE
ncbi:hypothetical protein CHU00_17715 [Sphingobacterium cellulitidis]|uniref:hypothetical protein n=1 Tax=Sphingobacterium cellulitidis TaxID=1768011 RepID=UPI000B93BA11|nr:hypothetical protein [Sphingobacterium cellulitidis]OYD44279.1 hypothetical protein CHU00_17715 [Sphingobacterium cellulitidis]